MTLVANLYPFATVFSLFVNIEVTIRDFIIEDKNLEHYWNSMWFTKLEGSDWNSVMIRYSVSKIDYFHFESPVGIFLFCLLLLMCSVGESSVGFT